jgi:hypothetical protein
MSAGRLEGSGLLVDGKGTCVKARKSTFQGNGVIGLGVENEANMQLEECTLASNKRRNVGVTGGASVHLVGCTFIDSLDSTGLEVWGESVWRRGRARSEETACSVCQLVSRPACSQRTA